MGGGGGGVLKRTGRGGGGHAGMYVRSQSSKYKIFLLCLTLSFPNFLTKVYEKLNFVSDP